MSFALPARQVTFGRSTHIPQQQQQQQQQQQAYAQPQQANNGLALPFSSNPYLPASSGLALPGSAPTTVSTSSSSFPQPQASGSSSQTQSQSQSPTQTPPAQTAAASTAGPVAGPSTPPQTAVPSTPAPLTLEQQHITAVEGIVPTLQNIVATVNLDCRLDLKTIALHARNAEYNPKVCKSCFL